MTGYQFLQAKRILSCYNNLEQVNENLKDVGLLHESIEDTETPGYQELEDEGLVNDFDQDNVEKGGEGSRGGKVIGHTKSGKAIYESPQHEKNVKKLQDIVHDMTGEHHHPNSSAGQAIHEVGKLIHLDKPGVLSKEAKQRHKENLRDFEVETGFPSKFLSGIDWSK